MVGGEGCQELRAVLGGAVVDTAQLRPHQVQARVIRLEGDAQNSVYLEMMYRDHFQLINMESLV